MSEFNNRINTQRDILNMVNNKINQNEALHGLSLKAIDRWVSINNISIDSTISKLLVKASEKLFFLANKSQEQITDEYIALSRDVQITVSQIKSCLHNIKDGKCGQDLKLC